MAFKHTPTVLELVKNSSPSTPAAGHVGLYFDNTTGLLKQINSDGTSYLVGNQLITKDEFGLETNLNPTTIELPKGSLLDLGSNISRLNLATNFRARRSMALTGIATATVSPTNCAGTLTASTSTGSTQVDGFYLALTTTAVPGNLAGITNSTPQHTSTAYNPVFEAVVRTSTTISSLRMWIGLIDGTPPNSDTLGINGVAFRFNATGGWTPITYSGSQTTGTTIGTVTVSTFYRLRIRVDSATSTAYFSVNDGTEQAISTTVPAARVNMTSCVIATAAGARGLLFSRMSCESD